MDTAAHTPSPAAEPKAGLSSFWLKLAAILAMTCNHAGYIFYAHLPLAARVVLIALGGMTFPIMAFLLVEGYRHTSNIRRYAMRLGVFALLSEVPFWLFLGHEFNVLFTLLAALGVLWVYDNVKNDLLRMLLALGLIALTIPCDWGGIGPVIVLLFYMYREKPWGKAVAVALSVVVGLSSSLGPFLGALAEGSLRNLPFVSYYAIGNTAALGLVALYNGSRGRHPMKWLFYFYYPCHIAVLGCVYLALFGDFPYLMVGFF